MGWSRLLYRFTLKSLNHSQVAVIIFYLVDCQVKMLLNLVGFSLHETHKNASSSNRGERGDTTRLAHLERAVYADAQNIRKALNPSVKIGGIDRRYGAPQTPSNTSIIARRKQVKNLQPTENIQKYVLTLARGSKPKIIRRREHKEPERALRLNRAQCIRQGGANGAVPRGRGKGGTQANK